jgi:hypothetical protein
VSPHPRVELESQVEWEHAGQDFYVPLAHIDVTAHEALIIRAGYFATPFGAFNEYQYPDFLRKTAQQPQFTREVVPALWSEAGLQLRGNLPLGGSSLNYAVYSSNGLEQRDSDPEDGIVEEGGSIRDMRNNARDKNHADKAFGGRLGGSLGEAVDVGLSAYTGAYTTDGALRLSMVGTDLTALPGRLTLRVEGAVALQQITDGVLTKWGGYVMVAYRATAVVEPYLWFEVVDVDAGDAGRQMGPLAGVLLRPLPKTVPSLQLKVEANTLVADDGVVTGQGISQLVLSF